MNIPPELEAKIVHTADCRCRDCIAARIHDAAVEKPYLTEKEFLAAIRLILVNKKWRSYHTHNSRKSDAGFPDLVAVREKRVVWIELKTENGQASAAQLNWIEDLKAAGQEVYLFRPSDWPEIVKLLT